MAWFWGSDEQVDNNGVNSVTVTNKVEINDDKMQILLFILIALNIIKITLTLIKAYNRNMKKKYSRSASVELV